MAAWTKHDWNGDGKVDKWDELYELSMLNQMMEDEEQKEFDRYLAWEALRESDEDDD